MKTAISGKGVKMSLEIWKTTDVNENYEVSTWGRVRNRHTKDILSQEKHNKGYMRVYFYDGTRRKHYKVHRLVATAFVPNPMGKPQVNHIDGNNRNNSFTNLEWVTDEENKEHQKRLEERCYEDSH